MTTITERDRQINSQIYSYELRLEKLIRQKDMIPFKYNQFGERNGYTPNNKKTVDAINSEIKNIKRSIDALYSI